jgi:dihydrofolate synthase/folylpolyglutamate synthase
MTVENDGRDGDMPGPANAASQRPHTSEEQAQVTPPNPAERVVLPMSGAASGGSCAFDETVRFLFSLGHELKVVKWDLERISTLLAALGNPHTRGRFVHVAGTNGKGSTCAMIESALRVSGLRTGLYTSPHLISPRERIAIAGEPISEQAWVAAFKEVHKAAERLLADEAIDTHPSFFETVTAMAFLALAQAGVEITVLETGLGGRLDATNVVDPEVAVITPIDFDHEAFLGSSIESIAAEKAGILKPGRPAVFAQQRPEALRVLENRALELDIEVRHSSAWRVENLVRGKYGSRFTLYGDEEIPIECPLAGAHQVENARTAVTALAPMGIPAAAIRAGITGARWPGRLEHVHGNPDIILDGAHNPAGARALADYIREFYPDEPIRIIFGAMRDKAVEEVTNILFPLAEEIVLAAPNQPRALNSRALEQMTVESTQSQVIVIAPSVAAALEVYTQRKKMTTFVTGSLFLVAEARVWFNK